MKELERELSKWVEMRNTEGYDLLMEHIDKEIQSCTSKIGDSSETDVILKLSGKISALHHVKKVVDNKIVALESITETDE